MAIPPQMARWDPCRRVDLGPNSSPDVCRHQPTDHGGCARSVTTHAWVRVVHPVGQAWRFRRDTCRAGGGDRGGRGQSVAHMYAMEHPHRV